MSNIGPTKEMIDLLGENVKFTDREANPHICSKCRFERYCRNMWNLHALFRGMEKDNMPVGCPMVLEQTIG